MLPLTRCFASHAVKPPAAGRICPQQRLPFPRMVPRRWQSGESCQTTRDWHATVTRQSTAVPLDALHEARVSWARARQSRMMVDPVLRARPPGTSDSTLDVPWRIVLVPRSRLRWLAEFDHTHEPSHAALWCIGSKRAAVNSNPIDVDGTAMQYELQSRRPAQGRFKGVVCGPYGERYSKYLFVIDHSGMHIVREMTPCDLSSRGIALHSLMREEAVVGGEIFFDPMDAGKVCINFGSARFPVRSNYQAEKVAEFVLAFGYDTVVAMIPEREFRSGEYGLADRYGKAVQNMVFRAGDD
ncbi:MAG: hypothetical protein RL404_167 [Pseudomonadota bacterium]